LSVSPIEGSFGDKRPFLQSIRTYAVRDLIAAKAGQRRAPLLPEVAVFVKAKGELPTIPSGTGPAFTGPLNSFRTAAELADSQ